MTSESKNKLRTTYRSLRDKIPVDYAEEAALNAAKIFIQQPIFKQSHHIACYLHAKNEFNSFAIIEAIWQAKKICYLPVLKNDEKALIFVRYEYGTKLMRNQYAILEPEKRDQLLPPSLLDIAITPLVAFDLFGHRLGTGGGYYDRTFSFLKNGNEQQIPQLIGLAYAIQQADILPFDTWDIELNAVLTENTYLQF